MTGLSLLSKSRDSKKHDEAKALDIIGIHSISEAKPNETWKTEEGAFWPKDFLPKDFKHARIFSFGFEPFDIFSDPSGGLFCIAGELFRAIVHVRTDVPSTRPLIIICHGLGGLLVEGALLRAKLDVMLNENNASIRPETIKTLPKVKSDWSLECFTDREDANYKLLVKDIKKTIKAGSKSTFTDNGYQNAEEKQPHGTNTNYQTLADVPLPYERHDSTLSKIPVLPETKLPPVASFSTSSQDASLSHHGNGGQGDASGYARPVSTITSQPSLKGTPVHSSQRSFSDTVTYSPPVSVPIQTVNRPSHTPTLETSMIKRRPVAPQHNTEPRSSTYEAYHPSASPAATGLSRNGRHPVPFGLQSSSTHDLRQTSYATHNGISPQVPYVQRHGFYESGQVNSARHFNSHDQLHFHPSNQRQEQHSKSFNPANWKSKSTVNLPSSGQLSGLNAHMPPIPAIGTSSMIPSPGPTHGETSHWLASKSTDTPNSLLSGPIPKSQKMGVNGQPSPSVKSFTANPVQSNIPPMFRPSDHRQMQTYNTAPQSVSTLVPNPEKALKIQKKSKSSKKSGTPKAHKAPKTPEARKATKMSNELVASKTPKAPKAQLQSSKKAHTPPPKAPFVTQQHAQPGKLSRLRRFLKFESQVDSRKEHKGHDHAPKSHLGHSRPEKTQNGYDHSAKGHSPKGQNGGHAAAHYNHGNSHHGHDYHDNDHYNHKIRPGSISSSSSSSNGSTNSGASDSSSSTEEKQHSRFRRLFGFGSKRDDSSSESSSSSEESDAEEATYNIYHPVMGGGLQGGDAQGEDVSSNNSSKDQIKAPRSSSESSNSSSDSGAESSAGISSRPSSSVHG